MLLAQGCTSIFMIQISIMYSIMSVKCIIFLISFLQREGKDDGVKILTSNFNDWFCNDVCV